MPRGLIIITTIRLRLVSSSNEEERRNGILEQWCPHVLSHATIWREQKSHLLVVRSLSWRVSSLITVLKTPVMTL
jgi:hypothetical protein